MGESLHRGAQEIVAATLGVLGPCRAGVLLGPALPALAKPQPSAELLTRLPSLGTTLRTCPGGPARTAAESSGPAVYLVDLLRTLDGAGSRPRAGAGLAHLELACDNTNRHRPERAGGGARVGGVGGAGPVVGTPSDFPT
jgi:hypothetical protein